MLRVEKGLFLMMKVQFEVHLQFSIVAFKIKEGVISSLPKAVEFSYKAFYLASHGGLGYSLNIENLGALVYWAAAN